MMMADAALIAARGARPRLGGVSSALTLGPHARQARHRALAWLAACAAVAVAALAFAAGAIYGSLPPAADPAARVAAILRTHGSRPVPVSVDTRVARAIVAVEDQRFFHHGAIDPVALGRAVVATVLHPGEDPGGSTIAQQLAKTLYVRRPESLLGRLQAIGLAFKLEHELSRPRILALYLNAIFFGHGHYGIGQAARGYFGRAPSALTWGQAALLAGLPQAPSAFDPVAHPALARMRRAQVLHRLAAAGLVSARTAARLDRAPLGVS
jgi:penicillin-binding protein 1A